MKWLLAPCLAICLFAAKPEAALAQNFDFGKFVTLDDVRQWILPNLPRGSSQKAVRAAFVGQGKATLKQHPNLKGTEKYLYDINLCRLYVWRWNISADYDKAKKLQQIYVNGFAVFPDGPVAKPVVPDPANPNVGKISKMERARPEADLGETALAYIMYDRDANPATVDDQSLIGMGPGRADPANMGNAVNYEEVEPWRSIFDTDPADFVAPYAKCP